MSSEVKGKTVIVTGAGGGLGKVIATTFLSSGANVAICDVNQERLSAVEAEWEKDYSGRFIIQKTDITDEAAVKKLVDDTVAKFGRLDVLVNNAGILDTFDKLGELEKSTWDRVINVNLTGTYIVAKAALLAMEKQDPTGGVIINIASNASLKGFHAGLAYTVSKHGVLGLTRNTAGFYGPQGIYSIALCLGSMVDTNISEGLNTPAFKRESMMQVLTANPVPNNDRMANALALTDVAKYCVFLSDKGIASSSNGAALSFNKNWPES